MKKGQGAKVAGITLGVLLLLGVGAVVAFTVILAVISASQEGNEPGSCRAAATSAGGPAIPSQWVDDLEAASAVSGVPVSVHAAMTEKESGWNEGARNTRSGAAGMAQAMPGTWALYGQGDPMNGADAIAFQGRYMAALMDLAGEAGLEGSEQVEGALGAYNWGDGNMAAAGWDWKQGPDETVDYVPSIMDAAQVEFSGGCEAVAYDGDLGDGEWAHPLPGSELTGGGAYGLRNVRGLPAWAQQHVGLDFATPNGGQVVAPFDAKVTAIYEPDGCVLAKGTGETKHGFAVCHLDGWGVEVGMDLSRGDVIGDEGTRATSVGVAVVRHLHFEMYEPSAGDPMSPGPRAPGVIDPTPLLREKGVL